MGKMHHLDVGCADACIIVDQGKYFLIDTHRIENYGHLLPASKHFTGVFITHQHYDHFYGLRFLKREGYSIEYLIYSPYQRRYGDSSVEYDEWNEFESLVFYFKAKGTSVFTPYRQNSWEKPFWQVGALKFWVLGPEISIACAETREIHDACLVIQMESASRKCLFTGDASDTNLEYISKNTVHYCKDILRASHHGSINGAQLDFIKGCNAIYTVISTASGVYESIPHPTALARYSAHTLKQVYRTDVDGTVTWDI